ncbi:MAG: CarD family transcriptional regulator [Clostridia bacterium]|nr:CarD family transcriptional regulator [Clostridia bacterium]
MYTVGTTVIYGSEGACKISEITDNCFENSPNKRLYYVLIPVKGEGKIFVPCDNEILVARMKKVLSPQEIKELISIDMPEIEWIADNRQRNRTYKEMLQSYDRVKIIALAKLLYGIKCNTMDKRRLYVSDEEILKRAIKLLHAEFSIVLKIEPDEVMPYIFGNITCEIK